MGYLKIPNLYKEPSILTESQCYAMEKIDGTSAHASYKHATNKISYSPGGGGSKLALFTKNFDSKFPEMMRQMFPSDDVVIYGEAYGGCIQKKSHMYGTKQKFVAFDVWMGTQKKWLTVPEAADVCSKLNIEFVHYQLVPQVSSEALDAQRDAPSVQSKRNGLLTPDFPREGVVLRPLTEKMNKWGERLITKHKRAEERETKTERKVGDVLPLITDAESIADEFVTEKRLEHILQKLPGHSLKQMNEIIQAMVMDIRLECKGEWNDTPTSRSAIGKQTAVLYKKYKK